MTPSLSLPCPLARAFFLLNHLDVSQDLFTADFELEDGFQWLGVDDHSLPVNPQPTGHEVLVRSLLSCSPSLQGSSSLCLPRGDCPGCCRIWYQCRQRREVCDRQSRFAFKTISPCVHRLYICVVILVPVDSRSLGVLVLRRHRDQP